MAGLSELREILDLSEDSDLEGIVDQDFDEVYELPPIPRTSEVLAGQPTPSENQTGPRTAATTSFEHFRNTWVNNTSDPFDSPGYTEADTQAVDNPRSIPSSPTQSSVFDEQFNLGTNARHPVVKLPDRELLTGWLLKWQDPLDHALARVVALAYNGLLSCPQSRHESDLAAHNVNTDNHLALKNTYIPPSQHTLHRNGPYIRYGLGLGRGRQPLDPMLMGTSREALPPGENLQAFFTGIDNQHSSRDQICLHTEHSPVVMAPSLPDIDSSITLTPHLTDILGGISIVLTEDHSKRIDKNLHIKIPYIIYPNTDGGRAAPETKHVPLHHIPHICLGYDGQKEPIYVFFTGLYDHKWATAHNRAPRLQEESLKTFFDRIVLPAIHRNNTFLAQRVPQTTQLANSISHSHRGEGQGRPSRGAPVAYTIKNSDVASLWQEIQNITNAAGIPANPTRIPIDNTLVRAAPGHEDIEYFHSMLFLHDSKGSKLRHQTHGTITKCLHEYLSSQQTFLRRIRYNSRVPFRQQYVDLGFDFQPHPNSLKRDLLARRCCIYNSFHFMHAPMGDIRQYVVGQESNSLPAAPTPADTGSGSPPRRRPRGHALPQEQGAISAEPAKASWKPPPLPRHITHTEYTTHLLRDSVSLTAEINAGHWLHENGFRYIQSYFIGKHRFDAQGMYPFSNPDIPHLGYSREAYATACKDITGAAGSREQGFTSLAYSMKRLDAVFSQPETSHGWRFEVRIASENLMRISAIEESFVELVRGLNPSGPLVAPTRSSSTSCTPAASLSVPASPEAFYHVPSNELEAFLMANIDKPLVGMDMISCYYGGGKGAPQAAASLYALLATYVRHFISHLPFKHSGFVTRNPDHERPGLGLYKTCEERGFGFFPAEFDIIDWQRLQLRGEWSSKLVIPEFKIAQRLHRFIDWQARNTLLEQVLELAGQPQRSRAATFIIELVVHLLLQEYRRCAFEKLFPDDYKVNFKTEYDSDSISFNLDSLRELSRRSTAKRPRAIMFCSGNKAAFKDAASFFDWTWTNRPHSFKRDRMASLSFRLYYQTALRALAGREVEHKILSTEQLNQRLFARFFEQHTAFPYPHPNGSLSQTQKNSSNRLVLLTKRAYNDSTDGASFLSRRSYDAPDKHVQLVIGPNADKLADKTCRSSPILHPIHNITDVNDAIAIVMRQKESGSSAFVF